MQNKQSEADRKKDEIYAAMETGNPRRAVGLFAEFTRMFPKEAPKLRAEIMKEYGHAL